MADSPLQNPGQGGVNPLSLSVEEMARLLSAAGGRKVTPEEVQADIDAGAPGSPAPGSGPDGQVRINLVHYAAWLVRQVQAEGGR